MNSTVEPHQSQLSEVQPITAHSSPAIYGLGSFGIESLVTVFSGFHMFYYIDGLGLAVAMAATINVMHAIWDAVSYPLMGFLSDNTRTRWGRRRPWLSAVLPFFIVLLILVYAVPKPFRQGNALFGYALVVFFLFDTAYSIMWINYSALFPELFLGVRERARASSYFQGLGMLGQLLGFAIPPIIYAKYGFVQMAILFAGIAGITLLFGIFRNPEDPNALTAPSSDLKHTFSELLKERNFLPFAIAVTFLMFISGVYTLATPFWIKYTLAASTQATSLIFAIVFIIAILSVSIWGKLVRILGVKKSWLWALFLGAVSAIILGLASNLVVGAIGAAAAGASMGGIQISTQMIMAYFVDRDLKRTGHRREAIYYSLLRVFGKLSKILESLALVLLGLLFGYTSGENPGPHPGNAFRFLMGVIPLVFTMIAWFIARALSFEEDQAKQSDNQSI